MKYINFRTKSAKCSHCAPVEIKQNLNQRAMGRAQSNFSKKSKYEKSESQSNI